MLTATVQRLRLPLAIMALSVAATFGMTGRAMAAPQVITLTPTSADQTVQPGITYTGKFDVVNQGGTTYDFEVYAAPYHVDGEDYEPGFTYTPGSPQVSDWFKFGIKKATIAPGKSVQVPYSVTVPVNTPPGGYYAVAFAETKIPTNKAGVTINQRVGELFYLNIPGPIKQEGSVLSWEVPWFQAPPMQTTLRIQNNGGVHFPANAKIQVKDIFGSTKFSVDTTKYLLPQTIRRVDIPWQKAPQLGLFRVSGTVTILGKSTELRPKYVLVMSIPVRIGLVFGTTALILTLLIRSYIRRRRHRSPVIQNFRRRR